jgi:hypothetical protein
MRGAGEQQEWMFRATHEWFQTLHVFKSLSWSFDRKIYFGQVC